MGSFLDTITLFHQGIKDCIFPRFCIECETPDTWLCERCQEAIPMNTTTRCPFCTASTRGEICSRCKHSHALDGLIVAAPYENKTIQAAIHLLKYQYIEELSEALGKCIGRALNTFDKPMNSGILTQNGNSVLIPVPLHKRRIKERGFNQAHLLAQNINRSCRIPLDTTLLARSRYTQTQTALGRSSRITNVSGAFISSRAFKKGVKNAILIDDVATTLATLEECAKALKTTNFTTVWAAVIARGSFDTGK